MKLICIVLCLQLVLLLCRSTKFVRLTLTVSLLKVKLELCVNS